MSFTNAHETHLLNYSFTTTSVTRPTAWYIGLHTSDPGEAGSSSAEVSGNGYARKVASFTVSGNLATNSGAIEFAAASGGNFGTITHISVMTASKTINDGDAFRIPAGSLDITLD